MTDNLEHMRSGLMKFAILIFIAAALIFMWGCAHCPKCVPKIEYKIVEVPVPVPCPEIKPPADPQWVKAATLTPDGLATAILANFAEALRHYVESRKGEGENGCGDSRTGTEGPCSEPVGAAGRGDPHPGTLRPAP